MIDSFYSTCGIHIFRVLFCIATEENDFTATGVKLTLWCAVLHLYINLEHSICKWLPKKDIYESAVIKKFKIYVE